MLKWLLILIGAGVLVIIAVMTVFGLMVWNHGRGFPKSILAEEVKDACFVSTQPFLLITTGPTLYTPKLWDMLASPNAPDYIYRDFMPDDTVGGVQLQRDLSDAIEIPVGTRFILKEAIQHRTLNTNDFYYHFQPEDIALEAHFIHSRSDLIKDETNGDYQTQSQADMGRFPASEMFAPCPAA